MLGRVAGAVPHVGNILPSFRMNEREYGPHTHHGEGGRVQEVPHRVQGVPQRVLEVPHSVLGYHTGY